LILLPTVQTPIIFPYTTLFRSLTQRARGVLDRCVGVDPVQIVQVDVVGTQASQTGLDGAAHVGRAASATWLVRAELRRQERLVRSEEHTSELQSRFDLVCRLLL